MVSVSKSLPESKSPCNPEKDKVQGARWRSVCLVLLLILGQGLLLHHIVQHGLEHAVGQQEDDGGCSFCAVGGHMVTSALPPQPKPLLVLAWVVCFLPVVQFVIIHCPQAFGARGPPLLSFA